MGVDELRRQTERDSVKKRKRKRTEREGSNLLVRKSSTASILKNSEGFRIIRRSNFNTVDSPETAVSIWTDTQSLSITPGPVSLETPESIYLRDCVCQADLLGTPTSMFRKPAVIFTVVPDLDLRERWTRQWHPLMKILEWRGFTNFTYFQHLKLKQPHLIQLSSMGNACSKWEYANNAVTNTGFCNLSQASNKGRWS